MLPFQRYGFTRSRSHTELPPDKKYFFIFFGDAYRKSQALSNKAFKD